jgi:hypothetical protein
LTEHRIPTQITFAAITGADRHLRVDFEPGTSSVTFLKQAIRAAKRRSPIRFYGAAIGVIINYSPDQAVKFGLDGEALEILPKAYKIGEISISLRGRPVSKDALTAILIG